MDSESFGNEKQIYILLKTFVSVPRKTTLVIDYKIMKMHYISKHVGLPSI